MKIYVFIFLFIFTLPTNADYLVDFVRVSCIPDAKFFDIDYRYIHNSATESSGNSDFNENGFRDPREMHFICTFPNVKYLLITKQGPWHSGMCGAAPNIILDLFRNGRQWIEKVNFGSDCGDGPTITRITIFDGEWNKRDGSVEICYKSSTKSGEKCKYYFEVFEKFTSFGPITMSSVREGLK